MSPKNNNESDRTVSPSQIRVLNSLADDCSASEGLPEDVHRGRVEAVCDSLAAEVEEIIDGLKSKTTFSDLEARVWALNQVVDENHESLSHDAIALFLSVEGGAESWLAPESIDELLDSARAKYDDAKDMVGEITFPQREDHLESPELVWLDSSTVADIEFLAAEGETIYDDVVSRWANEDKSVLGAREFSERYLDACGKESVAQLAVATDLLSEGVLPFVSYTSQADESVPPVVEETDAVEVDGERFDLSFRESPSGPETLGLLTIYASTDIQGMDAVDLETGLTDLDAAVTESTISFEELIDIARERMNAKVVTGEESPSGTLRVRVLMEDGSRPGTDRFNHIDRIKVADQTIDASVTQVDGVPEDIPQTVVWSAGEDDGVEEVSVKEGIDSLQEEIHEGGEA